MVVALFWGVTASRDRLRDPTDEATQSLRWEIAFRKIVREKQTNQIEWNETCWKVQ